MTFDFSPVDDGPGSAYEAWQRDLLTRESDARIRDLADTSWDLEVNKRIQSLTDPLGSLLGRAGSAVQGAGAFLGDVGQGLQRGFEAATAPPGPPAAMPVPPTAGPEASLPLDANGFPIGAAETTAQLQGQPLAPTLAPLSPPEPTPSMAPQQYPTSVTPEPSSAPPWAGLQQAAGQVAQGIGAANTMANRFFSGDTSVFGDIVAPLAPVAEDLRRRQAETETINRAQAEQLGQVSQAGFTPEQQEQFFQTGAGAAAGIAQRGAGIAGQLFGPRGEVLRDVAEAVPETMAMAARTVPQRAARAVEEPVSGLLGPTGQPLRLADLPEDLRRVGTKAVQDAIKEVPQKADFLDKAMAFTMSNLFTPATVGVNVVGNTVQTFARPIREVLEGRPIAGVKDLLAMGQQLPAAGVRGARTFVQGRRAFPAEEGAAQDIMATVGRPEAFPGPAGAALTTIARANQAFDEFFRSVNAAGAGAAARHNGWAPERAAKYIADSANASVLLSAPSRLTRAVTSLGQASEGSPIANAAWKLGTAAFFPFARITEQLAGRGLSVVAAPVTEIGRMLLAAAKRDPDAAREAFARWTMGMGTWGVVLDQYNRGNIAGMGTGSFQEQALARNARDEYGNPIQQAEASRLGGRWIPTDAGGYYGTAAGMMASAIEGWNDPGKAGQPAPEFQERLSNAFGNLGRQVARDFYLSDFIDFASAVAEGRGPEAVGRMAEDLSTRGTPGIVQPLTQGLDPYMREPQNIGEVVQSRIPGLSQNVPPRIDPTTGEPVRRSNDLLTMLLRSPATGEPNPVAAEVARLERTGSPVTVKQLPRTVRTAGGLEQTRQQRQLMQETYGRLTRQYTTSAMNTPGYASKSDTDKAKTLNQALGAAYQWGDIQLGDRIQRDPASKASLEKLSFPRYDGVKGTPDEIRRQNFETREAKNLLAEYRRAYGDRGEYEFYRANPRAWELAQRRQRDPEWLSMQDARVDQRYGTGPVTGAAGIGQANVVLPAGVR